MLAFSAHADAKGILQLLTRVAPKAVMLVHGEKQGMRFLKEKIMRDFGVRCWDPPDGWVTTVETEAKVGATADGSLRPPGPPVFERRGRVTKAISPRMTD